MECVDDLFRLLIFFAPYSAMTLDSRQKPPGMTGEGGIGSAALSTIFGA
jgi:hypothetical protein